MLVYAAKGEERLLACRAGLQNPQPAPHFAQVQAFHKLNQPAVIVKAREMDASLVQGVLESAKSKYKQKYDTDALSVSMADNYLPGPPSGGSSRQQFCAGAHLSAAALPICLVMRRRVGQRFGFTVACYKK